MLNKLDANRYIPTDKSEAFEQLWQIAENHRSAINDMAELLTATASTTQIIDMIKPLARDAFTYELPIVYNSEKHTLGYRGGAINHGALSGLSGDDHTQYLLAAGTRALTGDWAAGDFKIGIGGPVSADAWVPLNITASDDWAEIDLTAYSEIGSDCGAILFRHSASDTIGVLAETLDGDNLGYVYSKGVNSSSAWAFGPQISFVQDGNAGATYIPSMIQFSTGTNAAVVAERMRIDNAGLVTCYNNLATNRVQAISSSGLQLYDDGGNGIFVKDGGDVGIGTTSPLVQFDVSKGASSAYLFGVTYSTTDADHSQLTLVKSSNATVGVLAETATGESLGAVVFQGVNSSSARAQGVIIKALQNGAAGATYLGADLVVYNGTNVANVTEKLRLTSAGLLGINTPSPLSSLHASYITNQAAIYLDCYSDAANKGGLLYMRHSRGVAVDSLVETQTADLLGQVFSAGVNSSSARAAASGIVFFQDGAAGATYIPSKIAFYTGTNAAATAIKMTLDSAGDLTLTQNQIMASTKYIGLGAAAGRLVFTDAATDTISFSTCYVGVGTATPASLLEVRADAADPVLTLTAGHATDYDPQIQFRTDASPTVKWSIGVDGADDRFKFNNSSGVGGATALILDDATAWVGIGNIPVAVLDINSPTGFSGVTVDRIGIYNHSVVAAHVFTNMDVFGIKSVYSVDDASYDGKNLYGAYIEGTLTSGVFDNLYGAWIQATQSAGTLNTNFYGLVIQTSQAGTLTGTGYALWIGDHANLDYCIYQNGSRPNYLGGALTVAGLTTATEGVVIPTTKYIGIASDKGRIVFTDAATDTLVFSSCAVGIGATPSYTLHVDGSFYSSGYSIFGSGAPSLKCKKLTGTTGGTEGDSTNIAHGLTTSKIISFTCEISVSSTFQLPPGFGVDYSAGYEYTAYTGNPAAVESFVVRLHPTNSENILSKAITILVWYEE